MKKVRTVLDLIMTVLMPLQMLYMLIGEAWHEYAGTILFILFVAHNIINRKWYSSLFKGKYSFQRGWRASVNLLLIPLMLLLFISGVMMSNYTFSFLGISSLIDFARTSHMATSYWGFIVLSLHVGNHIGRFVFKNNKSITAFSILSLFGIYSFFSEGIWRYLFLIDHFVFFNFDTPLIVMVLKYISIMILFATLSSIICKVSLKKSS